MMTRRWKLIWEAGPDAGGCTVVGPGVHIVGRAAGAPVRCDDPALEPHHLLIEVSADGLMLRQLTGRVPLRSDGEAIDDSSMITSTVTVEIGHSLLTACPTDLTAPGHRPDLLVVGDPANITETPAGNVLVRRPRAAVEWVPQPIRPVAGETRPGGGGSGALPAVLALFGSGVVAVLLHQPMFLLFGGIGAVVALGTWGGQRVSALRHRRRHDRVRSEEMARFDSEVDAQRSGFVAHLRATVSTPAAARQAIDGRTADLWARRGSHADGLAVSIGLGAVAWAPLLDQGAAMGGAGAPGVLPTLPVAPLVADIGPTCRLALRGETARCRSAVRSIVVQLAANCGPADARFVVVTHEPARWRWLDGLPHASTAGGLPAIIAESELMDVVAESHVAPHPHLVVITDAAELLAARTSPLRRVVTSDRSVALLVVVDAEAGIPHVCSSLLDVCGPTMARWHADAAVASLPVPARWFGISELSAVRLIGRLDDLIDPEDPLSTAGGIPREVTMLSLLPSAEPAAIAASWVAGGHDPLPRTVIGVAADGVVDIDLDRDGPHALLAGTTGAGKSELLRSLVAGLAVGSSPDHLTFVLIDYKGGSTFDACANLPHVVGVVTDLDDHLAARALRSLHAELRRREQLLRGAGAADLAGYRRLAPGEVLPRLIVVIDEFAALVTEQPEFLHALVGIAQRGRSLGVHLILATQRPSGVISDDIRANTNLRIALRLHDAADALDVVGDPAPAAIPRGLAGRAVMRLGPDEVLTFQTGRCTAPSTAGSSELDQLVSAVRAATVLVGAREPASPWLPPLPPEIAADDASIAGAVVGAVDDPDNQRIVPLVWDRADGHLLVVGAAGLGVTSALCLLGAVAAADGCHLYVIDARGDQALTIFERSPWCGGVVRLHQRERLLRTIARLAGEIRHRIAEPEAPRHPIVVLIDGYDAVRTALDDLDTSAEYEMLEAIVANGAANDVTVVAAFDRVAAIPSAVLSRCAQRWVFHLTDALDGSALGVAAADVPGPHPGRIVVAASGLEAQLMSGPVPLPACVDGLVPTPIECLPAEIDAANLPPASARADTTSLPLGLRFGDGQPCAVDVPDGEHLMIIGPPRSGRSMALQRVVRAWCQAHADGWWCLVAPRRPPSVVERRHRWLADVIDDIPTQGAVLIAVDDAELVDDIGGALASLAASRRHGLLIVAAGKPDSLRQSYGHWTSVVRRSRLGLVTTASNDVDGDLIGATLPRRTPINPRPGLAWLVGDGDVVLVQLAVDRATAQVAPPAGRAAGTIP